MALSNAKYMGKNCDDIEANIMKVLSTMKGHFIFNYYLFCQMIISSKKLIKSISSQFMINMFEDFIQTLEEFIKIRPEISKF